MRTDGVTFRAPALVAAALLLTACAPVERVLLDRDAGSLSSHDGGRDSAGSGGGDDAAPSGRACLLPGALDFGVIAVATSARLSVRVTGCGDGSIALTGATTSPNPPFAVIDAPTLPNELPPGSAVAIAIRFAPTEAGTVPGRLVLSFRTPSGVSVEGVVPLTGSAR